MIQIQHKAFVERLRMLATGAGIGNVWVNSMLRIEANPWDLYDAAKEVALALFVTRQSDDWLVTYIKLCREYTPSKVEFLPG